MEYSAKLNEFVDGSLSRHQEEELFSRLASDSSLRSELKQLIELEKVAKNDYPAFMPPSQTTASVFSKLGIAQASTAATGGAVAGFFSKYSSNIFSGLASAVATFLIMLAVFPLFNNSEEQMIAKAPEVTGTKLTILLPEENKPEPIAEKNNNIPVVSMVGNDDNIKEEKHINNSKTEKIVKPTHILTQQENTKTSGFSDNFIISDNNRISDNIKTSDNSPLFITPIDIKQSNIALNEHYEIQSINSSFLDGWSIELKGGEYWALPGSTVPRSSEPALENMSIIFLKDISSNFSYGLDMRQEFFFQEYDGTDDEGLPYKYEQHTNYFAVGIVGRYDFLKTKYYNGFGQLYLGANKVGPVGRGLVGFEINPSSKYGFIIGIEGSVLRFYHGENYFVSPKIGLHYGVKFNLQGGR